MLRTWLYETVHEEEKDQKIMLGMFRQIIQTISIRVPHGPEEHGAVHGGSHQDHQADERETSRMAEV